MGSIKQTYLKRVAQKLVREYGDEMSTDFEVNKKKVGEHTDITSKTGRNKIAGCITKMVKAKQKKLD